MGFLSFGLPPLLFNQSETILIHYSLVFLGAGTFLITKSDDLLLVSFRNLHLLFDLLLINLTVDLYFAFLGLSFRLHLTLLIFFEVLHELFLQLAEEKFPHLEKLHWTLSGSPHLYPLSVTILDRSGQFLGLDISPQGDCNKPESKLSIPLFTSKRSSGICLHESLEQGWTNFM